LGTEFYHKLGSAFHTFWSWKSPGNPPVMFCANPASTLMQVQV